MLEAPPPLFSTLVRLPVRVLLGLVGLYQAVISPVLPAIFGPACGCRFHPTCSHYAAQALRTHGAVVGAGLALWRLVKCTPLHPGGFDPVPRRWSSGSRAGARRRGAPTCFRLHR